MAKIFEPEVLELSNGVPVVLQHFEGPVASTYWWVKAGSADEQGTEAGFAHFLEHMHFKDAAAKETGKASTGKMAQAVESLGGDINAYTSFDQTVYHVTCAAHHWERVIDVFGGMAKPQRFLKSDFEREREVILEELRKNEDSPGRQLFQSLFAATFKKHPYGKPVIGFEKLLKGAKLSSLEAFYKRNYVSSNMGIILVGPVGNSGSVRRERILKSIEKYFGSKVIKSSKGAKMVRRNSEPALRNHPDFVVRPFDVKMPSLSFSFRVPELMHPDIPALDVLSGVLGMGELSRLYQRLFYQKSLVSEISSGLYVPKDPGMFYVQAEPSDAKNILKVCEEIFLELKRMQDEGPTPEELARVLVNAESERLYVTQTADGVAGRVGFLKFVLGDLRFDESYLDDLRAVDATRVREVAREYIDFRRMAGAILVPKDFKEVQAEQISELAKSILKPASPVGEVLAGAATRGRKKETALEQFKLASGCQVLYYPRPHSHVFSAHACVLGGLRLELAQPVDRASLDWGSSFMMSLTWAKGTSTKDAKQISGWIESHAASMDGFSGRNTVGLQMTGLAKDWGPLSPLFLEVLLDPSFPDDEVDHARRIAEDQVRSIEDHSSQLCTKLFLKTLFENHPYGNLTSGSLESLKTIQKAKLKKFHDSWVRPDRLVVAISGDIKKGALDLWMSELERLTSSRVSSSPSLALPRIEDEPELKASRWVEQTLKREQTHIIVGGLGTKITAEDRYALRILQTLIGGQSGRLFIELREKKSLAYTVAPMSFEGVERGYVGTYIACAPGKREEAISGIRAVYERLAQKGPSSAEMKRAKEFYLGRRAMDLQSDPSLASHYGLERVYGLDPQTDEQIIKRVSSVSAKDVQELCRKYYVDPPQVTAVVS